MAVLLKNYRVLYVIFFHKTPQHTIHRGACRMVDSVLTKVILSFSDRQDMAQRNYNSKLPVVGSEDLSPEMKLATEILNLLSFVFGTVSLHIRISVGEKLRFYSSYHTHTQLIPQFLTFLLFGVNQLLDRFINTHKGSNDI